ncbi:MAG: M1 family metallopeptidase [Candidatus Electryonea clarkiae]|nr:M1 family metallopeptidase [Candidatus Electryonea clarkiae]MDP8285539.1 M1 family metallopeptidase [Candidatus Electryonea clarkiae]
MLLFFQTSFSKLPEWQQQVNYDIDVTLIDSIHTWQGTAQITYINNSPDTLATLWFRLPAEARKEHSIEDGILFRGRNNRLKNLPEKNWGGLNIDSSWCDNRTLIFKPDGSIGSLLLDPPILPGDSAIFTLAFRSKFPSGKGSFRIAWINGQYKGAYWYPMICPYTPEYGWTVNRYFGTAEAYGEFGDFNIRYTVPNRFIVASTGVLVNENEVLPPERMEGLAISNSDPIPIPDEEEGERPVTWIYRAENVPDVAFAADPKFVIDRIDYGSFESWAFVRRGRQEQWDDAAEVCGWTIQQLEEIYGKYPWPRVYATDSYSAMEYPMLTMMSSETPGYRYVMMHEVIHNYTPMILHSNSVDAPVLDEGFTTFIEHELINRYDGTPYNRKRTITRGLFSKEFVMRDDDIRGRRPYLESVLEGKDLPMVRGADIANDYWQLRVSTYYKTPIMLNALRSVIGEEAFWRGFRIYYRDNALSHVDENDMIEAFEESSGRGLGWFFKQFLYDSGDIDYAFTKFEVRKKDSSYNTKIGIKRNGEIRLPIKLAVICETGDTLLREIPFLLTDPASPGYQQIGQWDQLHDPSKEVEIIFDFDLDRKPVKVLLDPENSYADRNSINNEVPAGRFKLRFDNGLTPKPPASLDSTIAFIGPLFGYNYRDKLLGGVNIRSSYMERRKFFATDVVASGHSDVNRVHARVMFAKPLGNGYMPPQSFVSAGNMHRDQWLILGLRRQWISQKHINKKYRNSIHFGALHNIDKSLLDRNSSRDSKKNTPYVRINYYLQNSRYKFSSRLSLTGGISDASSTGFGVIEWDGVKELAARSGWRFRIESRFYVTSNKTINQFRPTINSSSPYKLLGEPLFGNAWHNESNLPRFPLAYSNASFAYAEELFADQLMSYRILLNRPLPKFMSRTILTPFNRFINKFKIGLFHTGGFIFSDDFFPISFLDGWGTLVEAGPEITIDDLYGVSFSIRAAPLYNLIIHENSRGTTVNDSNSREHIDTYSYIDNNWADFGSKIVIVVKLKRDNFFRF